MPKKYRISHADFKLAENARFRRERGSFFTLSHGSLPGEMNAPPRAAFIVSKKAAARAVDRNRIKRRGRAIVQEFIATAAPGAVFIFHVGRNAKLAPFSDIKEDIKKLMEKSSE